jgi:hypothetical protein
MTNIEAYWALYFKLNLNPIELELVFEVYLVDKSGITCRPAFLY